MGLRIFAEAPFNLKTKMQLGPCHTQLSHTLPPAIPCSCAAAHADAPAAAELTDEGRCLVAHVLRAAGPPPLPSSASEDNARRPFFCLTTRRGSSTSPPSTSLPAAEQQVRSGDVHALGLVLLLGAANGEAELGVLLLQGDLHGHWCKRRVLAGPTMPSR